MVGPCGQASIGYLIILTRMFAMARPNYFGIQSTPLSIQPGCDLDVVVVSKSKFEVLNSAAASLRRYMHPCPRRIYLVVPSASIGFCTGIPDAECVDERSVLDLDCQRIECALIQKGFLWSWKLTDDRGCWYYQQLVKLFSLKRLNLTENYVLWDADNVLIRPYTLFVHGRPRVMTSGYDVKKYIATTSSLLGIASTLERVVTHHALINSHTMHNIIRHLCPRTTDDLFSCAMHILKSIPSKQVDVNMAFSEYHLYLSWVLFHHPHQVHLDKSTSFMRGKVNSSYNAHTLSAQACPKCPFAVLEHVHQQRKENKSNVLALLRLFSSHRHCSLHQHTRLSSEPPVGSNLVWKRLWGGVWLTLIFVSLLLTYRLVWRPGQRLLHTQMFAKL